MGEDEESPQKTGAEEGVDVLNQLVRVTEIESATSASQMRRSTKLSYTLNKLVNLKIGNATGVPP